MLAFLPISHEVWFAAMQLAVPTIGEYEVICAEIIDNLRISLVPYQQPLWSLRHCYPESGDAEVTFVLSPTGFSPKVNAEQINPRQLQSCFSCSAEASA
jgi:hypothetical protein